MTKIEGDAKRVTIFIGESDRWHHKPLYQAIVEMLRAEGCAGATVLRGIEGFGAASRIHTANILRLSEDLPIVIVFIDKAERVESVMHRLDEMVTQGLITVDDVHIVKYTRGDEEGAAAPDSSTSRTR
jgi:PII-like signaling protein